jgi:hypothetical protein
LSQWGKTRISREKTLYFGGDLDLIPESKPYVGFWDDLGFAREIRISSGRYTPEQIGRNCPRPGFLERRGFIWAVLNRPE